MIRQLADKIIPVTVILTKVRICILQALITIPDQVRNDGTAVVILTNPPGGNYPVAVIPELNSGKALTKVSICNRPVIVILTKVRICVLQIAVILTKVRICVF